MKFAVPSHEWVTIRPGTYLREDQIFHWENGNGADGHTSLTIYSEWAAEQNVKTGSNAFGVTKPITASRQKDFVVYYPHSSYAGIKDVLFASRPDQARLLEKDLRIALVTQLRSPCFIAGAGHLSPTLNDPRDQSLEEFGVVGSANPKWVIYRQSTKEVLKRGSFR